MSPEEFLLKQLIYIKDYMNLMVDLEWTRK